MKKYKININHAKKQIVVDFMGQLKMEDAAQFQVEYTEEMKGVNCKEFDLVLGAKELKTFNSDSIGILEACYKLYGSQGFKSITIIESTENVCNMQLKRVAKSVQGFSPIFKK